MSSDNIQVYPGNPDGERVQDASILLQGEATKGAAGQFEETGNGEVVPIDGETVGDGTTSANHQSVSTDKIIIGGTLYEEDDNSPINVSSTPSTTFNLANPSAGVVIIPDRTGDAAFDQIQINGDTGNNYDIVNNADNETSGLSQWDVQYWFRTEYYEIHIRDGVSSQLSVNIATSDTGQTVGGKNTNVTSAISSITFKDSGGSNRSGKARVYRQVMNV